MSIIAVSEDTELGPLVRLGAGCCGGDRGGGSHWAHRECKAQLLANCDTLEVDAAAAQCPRCALLRKVLH